MATASAVVSRRGNDQFRGIFSDTWVVRATLDAGSLVDGAGETDDITVPSTKEPASRVARTTQVSLKIPRN